MEEKSAKKETDEGAQCTDDIASRTELKEMPEKTKLGFNAVPEKLHWKETVEWKTHSPEEMEVGQQWMKEGLLRSLSKQM